MKQYPSQIPGLPISDDGQALLVSGYVTVPAGGSTEATLLLILAELQAQTTLLETIVTNTTPVP